MQLCKLHWLLAGCDGRTRLILSNLSIIQPFGYIDIYDPWLNWANESWMAQRLRDQVETSMIMIAARIMQLGMEWQD